MKKAGDRFDLETTIPPNTTATVSIPGTSIETILESGHPLEQAVGVKFLRMEANRIVLSVESGTYRFQSGGIIKPSSK